MAPTPTTARRGGGVGCVVGFLVVLAGVGLVLLGNESRTAEAMPFGLALLPIGVVIGLVGIAALARHFRASTEDDAVIMAGGHHAPPRPPASIQCPQCGGAAAIRLADPTHGSCGFCRARFPLAPELAHAVQAAAAVVHQQGQAERQIEAQIAELAAHEREWTRRLTTVTLVLAGLGGLMALGGLALMQVDRDWPYYVGTGVAAGSAALVLGLIAMRVVPPAVRQVVGRWTAIRLPGEAGLGCRVCGGPLPAVVAPVLRCAYCAADNLASGEVLAKVEATARHAQRGVLAIAARRQRGDDLAAVALRSLPLAVGLSWIVVGGLANPVLGALLAIELPAGSAPFEVLRVESGGSLKACLAATEESDAGTVVFLDAWTRFTVSAAQLATYRAAPPMTPDALVGRRVTGGRVADVYVTPRRPAARFGRVDGGGELYFPSTDGGGALLCLEDVAVGPGPALPVTAR